MLHAPLRAVVVQMENIGSAIDVFVSLYFQRVDTL